MSDVFLAAERRPGRAKWSLLCILLKGAPAVVVRSVCLYLSTLLVVDRWHLEKDHLLIIRFRLCLRASYY